MKLTKIIIIIIFLACSSFINGQTNSEILKRQAIENMQSGSYERAIDRLKNYISMNPYDADGYSLRGICYERMNNYRDAFYDYKRAKQIDSTDSEILKNLERVETEWNNSIYDEIAGYKEKIKANPSIAENYLKIADQYLLIENYTLAEKWYDEYLNRDHNSTPEEILKYTEVFAKNNSIEKGENLLSVYVFKYPGDWRLYTRLGYFKLWAGKNEEAKKAFNTALEIKPFNKEAEEGLDLANSFVNVSVSEMLPKQNSYLIESYLQMLLNDPNRDDIRFNLVEQLIKSGLYEEAYSHLKYLAPNYEGTSRYDDLLDLTEEGREEYYDKLINSYKEKFDKNNNEKDILLKLVELNNKLRNYGDSEDVLESYLKTHPNDDEVIYLLTETYSYDNQYSDAFQQIKKAIEINPAKEKYKILASKLIVLAEDEANYSYAHNLLNEILRKNPREIDAFTFLGRLNYLEGYYKEANTNAMFAARIDPSNPDLVSLLIDLKDKLPEQEGEKEITREVEQPAAAKVNDLEIARNLALNSKCEEAVDYYLKYIDEKSANKDLLLELADVYNCAGEYGEAEDVYDFLLEKKDDYQIKKLKAKSLYLDGDFGEAIAVLSQPAIDHPDDFELQTLLADSYAGDGEYDKARDVYNLIEQDAPEYLLVAKRKDWLPVNEVNISGNEESSSAISQSFFNYMNLYPELTYYRGNDGFNFSTVGTGGEIGLIENLAVGGNVHRGYLSNDFGNTTYMSYVGSLIYRPSQNWKIKAGYGRMTSKSDIDQPVYEGSVEYKGHTRYTYYSAGINYKYTDASTVLSSQGLVFNRLSVHYGNLTGWYRFRKGLNIYADYKIYLLKETPVFKQNIGNSIDLKIAKEFYEDFKAGYEYYFADFKYKIPTYYTPQKFVSHSLFAEWDVYADVEWDINLIGRLGYVPDEDHIIREISAKVVYKGLENLNITASGFAGETSRNRVNYRAFSFFLTASWNFIK